MKFIVTNYWNLSAKHFGNQIVLFLLAPLNQKSERKYEKK